MGAGVQKLTFTKMSGGGNDFILFDNRERVLKGDLKGFIREICQRRISVGADGDNIIGHNLLPEILPNPLSSPSIS